MLQESVKMLGGSRCTQGMGPAWPGTHLAVGTEWQCVGGWLWQQTSLALNPPAVTGACFSTPQSPLPYGVF